MEVHDWSTIMLVVANRRAATVPAHNGQSAHGLPLLLKGIKYRSINRQTPVLGIECHPHGRATAQAYLPRCGDENMGPGGLSLWISPQTLDV